MPCLFVYDFLSVWCLSGCVSVHVYVSVCFAGFVPVCVSVCVCVCACACMCASASVCHFVCLVFVSLKEASQRDLKNGIQYQLFLLLLLFKAQSTIYSAPVPDVHHLVTNGNASKVVV